MVQRATLDHWAKSVAGVQLEEYHSILPKTKGKYAAEQKMCWKLCGQEGADHAHDSPIKG